MTDYTAVDRATLELAAHLIRVHLAKPEVDILVRYGRRNAADFLVELANNPDKLKEALRPGTLSI